MLSNLNVADLSSLLRIVLRKREALDLWLDRARENEKGRDWPQQHLEHWAVDIDHS